MDNGLKLSMNETFTYMGYQVTDLATSCPVFVLLVFIDAYLTYINFVITGLF